MTVTFNNSTTFQVQYPAGAFPIINGESAVAPSQLPWIGTAIEIGCIITPLQNVGTLTVEHFLFDQATATTLATGTPFGIPTAWFGNPQVAFSTISVTLAALHQLEVGVQAIGVSGGTLGAQITHVYVTVNPVDGVPLTPSAPSLSPVTMSSWLVGTQPSALETHYIGSIDFQRSTDGGSTWSLIHTTTDGTGMGLSGSQTFTDTGVPAGSLQYRVIYHSVSSTATSPAAVAPLPTAPAAPMLAPVSMTSWTVSWTSAANAYQYAVQRSTDGGSTWVTQTTQTGTTWTDPSVPAGPLAYRIVAQNSVGNTTGASTTATVPGGFGFAGPTLSEILT